MPAERHLRLSPALVIGGLFALSLLAYLALLPAPREDGQLIGSDGVAYFVFLPSALFDHDLEFADEYAYFRDPRAVVQLQPDGRPGNQYGVGAAMLWLPFYALAHLLTLGAAALGAPVRADGLGAPYQAAVSIASICYGALGLLLIARSVGRITSASAALLAVAALWVASNSIYYMLIEPSMAHMVGLFAVALLYSLWHGRLWRRSPRPRDGLLLGLAGGLVLLIRLQDGPLLLAPYGLLLWGAIRGPSELTPAPRRAWLVAGLLAAVGTGIALLPQLLAWRLIYGSWFALPYLSDHDPAFFWLSPRLDGVLVSSARGLFVWHPIYALAALGLVLLARRDRALALYCGLALAADVYLVASWWAWAQGDSFGGRMFISAMWIWGLGLAVLAQALLARPRLWRLALALLLALVLWNGLALLQYRLALLGRPGLPTWADITVERLRFPLELLDRLRGP